MTKIRVPPKFPGGERYGVYLNDLFVWLKDVATGFIRLDFLDNFQSFRTDVSIANGATVQITNPLPFVPSARIIVRQTGNGVITDGTWNRQVLEMINNGPNDVTASIIFFK